MPILPIIAAQARWLPIPGQALLCVCGVLIPGLGGEIRRTASSTRIIRLSVGNTIFLAALVIFMNVVVDIAYTIIDPRIKLK